MVPSRNMILSLPLLAAFGGSIIVESRQLQTDGVVCQTKEQCQQKFKSIIGGMNFYVGDYSTKGCFLKGTKGYFGTGGTLEQMSETDLPGVRERIMCDVETDPPTGKPTQEPTDDPTKQPTPKPVTESPTKQPTKKPSLELVRPPNFDFLVDDPTQSPSLVPTLKPTNRPSLKPTAKPTNEPTSNPTSSPTEIPSYTPTESPSSVPTKSPTKSPSSSPSAKIVLKDPIVIDDSASVITNSTNDKENATASVVILSPFIMTLQTAPQTEEVDTNELSFLISDHLLEEIKAAFPDADVTGVDVDVSPISNRRSRVLQQTGLVFAADIAEPKQHDLEVSGDVYFEGTSVPTLGTLDIMAQDSFEGEKGDNFIRSLQYAEDAGLQSARSVSVDTLDDEPVEMESVELLESRLPTVMDDPIAGEPLYVLVIVFGVGFILVAMYVVKTRRGRRLELENELNVMEEVVS